MRRLQVLCTPKLRVVAGLISEFYQSQIFVRLQVTRDLLGGRSRNLRFAAVLPEDKTKLVAERLAKK